MGVLPAHKQEAEAPKLALFPELRQDQLTAAPLTSVN